MLNARRRAAPDELTHDRPHSAPASALCSAAAAAADPAALDAAESIPASATAELASGARVRGRYVSDASCSMLATSLHAAAQSDGMLATKRAGPLTVYDSSGSSESIPSITEASDAPASSGERRTGAPAARGAPATATAEHTGAPLADRPARPSHGALYAPAAEPCSFAAELEARSPGASARAQAARAAQRRVPNWPVGRCADADSPPRSPLARPPSCGEVLAAAAARAAARAATVAPPPAPPLGVLAAAAAAMSAATREPAAAAAPPAPAPAPAAKLCAAAALRYAAQSVLDRGGGDFAIFWAPSVTNALLSFQFCVLSRGVHAAGAEDRYVLASMYGARSAALTFPQGVGLPGAVWASRLPFYSEDLVAAAREGGGCASCPLLPTALLRVNEREACDVRSTLVQPFGRGVLEVGTVRRAALLVTVSDAAIWGLVKAHADRHHAAVARRERAERAARAVAAADGAHAPAAEDDARGGAEHGDGEAPADAAASVGPLRLPLA
ncbi:hypothetical protein KFE25_004645 [Diacronema lutheri]|uniref:Uncharacterized protein n=1 Tax=Diacronema lutheri TaxID=2081491 RepID=A0A8J6C7D1_DIALT|nr:hypothetical protein KFE25_004645 [Diacronema lutheri]